MCWIMSREICCNSQLVEKSFPLNSYYIIDMIVVVVVVIVVVLELELVVVVVV